MKLAFHKGTGILSRAIEYGTHSPYSHVELIFSDGMSFSARAELSPAVNIIPFNAGSNPNEWDFIDLPARLNEPKIRAWAELQKGKGYDWGADFSFPLPFIKSDESKLMCASSCTMAIQQDGVFKGFVPCEVSPGQLSVMARVLIGDCS